MSRGSAADEIAKLAALHEKGLISKADFEIQRDRLLVTGPGRRPRILSRTALAAGFLAVLGVAAWNAVQPHGGSGPSHPITANFASATQTQIDAVVRYATEYANSHATDQDGQCLRWAAIAWDVGNVDIRGTAAQDATALSYWAADPKGWVRHPSPHVYNNPPPGALVFWGANPYPGGDSGHVAISIGNNQVASTAAWPYLSRPYQETQAFVFALTQRDPTVYNYLGYIMPLESQAVANVPPANPPTAPQATANPVNPPLPGGSNGLSLQGGGSNGVSLQGGSGTGVALQPATPPPAIPPTPSAAPTVNPTPIPASLPVFTVMNTDQPPPDGVWFRNSPHTADTNKITGDGVYAGERVQLQCYAFGDAVGPYNDTVWYFVANLTRPTISGLPDSGYLNAHFINDGQLANQIDSGVPVC